MRVRCPRCKNIMGEQVGQMFVQRTSRGGGIICEGGNITLECGKCGMTSRLTKPEPYVEINMEINMESGKEAK